MINASIKNKLDIIDTAVQRYNETIYCAVSEKELRKYKKWCLKNCDELSLSKEYIGFISIIDCFDYNGLSFYSANCDNENNVYESNEIYWGNNNLKEYLFIGEDSISWYTISINNGKFYILDKPSGSVMGHYQHFEELLLIALESIL